MGVDWLAVEKLKLQNFQHCRNIYEAANLCNLLDLIRDLQRNFRVPPSVLKAPDEITARSVAFPIFLIVNPNDEGKGLNGVIRANQRLY